MLLNVFIRRNVKSNEHLSFLSFFLGLRFFLPVRLFHEPLQKFAAWHIASLAVYLGKHFLRERNSHDDIVH
jgi:hypothetical protein